MSSLGTVCLGIGPLLLAGCAALVTAPLPKQPVPLASMEEPLELFGEPADEGARGELATGSFTGLVVGDARSTLDEMADQPPGVCVVAVVENSPGAAAGLEEGDVLSTVTPSAGPAVELAWPSQWRAIELEAAPGSALRLRYDRAGSERAVELMPVPRVRAAARHPAERYREEARVGVVLRTATEVEARGAGLGPGGGAVIVGLDRGSPWRRAGLRYGDLLVAVAGRSVHHPQVVLDAIREGTAELAIDYIREGERMGVAAGLTRRARAVSAVHIPLLYHFERERGSTEWSILSGALRRHTTPVAWEWRVLWFFRMAGGDADRLQEVAAP